MHRDGIEVALAATVGAVIALVIWALMQNPAEERPAVDQAGTSEVDQAGSNSTATTQPLRDQADIAPFLTAFRASRTGTYKVSGSVQVAQAGTDDTTRIAVSTVRRAGEFIEESGTTLVVSTGGQEQICERSFGEDLACGEVLEPTPVDAEVDALENLFTGTAPEYLLYDDQPGCWQLVATSNPAPAQWGQATTICFDDETGAIIRQTTSSVQGIRTYVADNVSAEVGDDDLVPPTS